MNIRMITAVLCIMFARTASAVVVLQDDFSGGKGAWVARAIAGGAIAFTDGAVKISPDVRKEQPVSVFRDIGTVVLRDGDTLRITVDVSTSFTTAKDRDLRIGLGFSNPAISGDSTVLLVPLTGYICGIPSAGSTADPRIIWVNAGGGSLNFFNSSTATVGNPALDNKVSASSSPKTWVFEITRNGNELVFSGSLGGNPFGKVIASGDRVINGFQFNTVGLSYAYAGGQTAMYDNLKVEVIPVVILG